MKQELVVAPSVLSLDFSKPSEQLKALDESSAKWVHFDVMDGHFVPNLTFGPDILKGMKKAVDKVMDVHLMVSDPMMFAERFLDAGADIVTFHVEALASMTKLQELCRYIRSRGAKAGVSLRPKTDVQQLLPYLAEMDLVLVMSVEPGFGGQAFMEDQLEKVRMLRKAIDAADLSVRLEIDGGINAETGALAVQAGCDTLVAGSYVFRQDIETAVQSLLCLGSC